ncbi:hypothetical protein [Hydrogenoanaerobacterium sp.]|uniref:hypothetical protein n=1 Tax=Hydrogenoanaerobacterium sp. TaxID=2953763 RepID=UPI00289AD6B4|nr:hypothetical protein [Hydrogenoanaerobacterium sp.]
MILHKLLNENKLTLVVSLPSNNLSLAEAALEGGAQAVKVHANVWHRASGHTFGTYAENKNFLRDLIALCGKVPVGLVPGGEEAFVSNDERLELEAMGLDFFSAYAKHLPAYMMESKVLTKMPAIDCTYDQNTLDAVRLSKIDVLECSIQPGEAYGTPLNYADLLRYTDISAKAGKPTLIPTQKKIRSEEARHLYEAGCKAVMIGAVVMGKEPGAQEVKRACTAFRDVIESL